MCLWMACSAQPDLETAASEIQQMLDRGDLRGARARLAELRESPPSSPEDAIRLVELTLRMGEGQQAVWLAEQAIEAFPESHQLRLMLGYQALGQGDGTRAAELAGTVPPDAEEYFGAQILLTRATLATGDLEGGLAVLDRLIERYPDRPEPWAQRALHLAEEQRLDEARQALDRARELATDDQLRLAIELANSRLLAFAGDPDGAVALLEVILQDKPDAAGVLAAIVDIYASAGRLEDATRRLERAVAENATFAPFRVRLANLYLEQDRGEDALAVLKDFVDTSGSIEALTALARLHTRRGEPALAAAVLERAVKLTQAPLIRVQRAEALIDAGQLDRARQEVDAFESQGETTYGEYIRARLELAEGKAEAAVARFGRVVSELDTSYAQYWLARALEETGRYEDAMRRYRLAQQRDKSSAEVAVAMLRLATSRSDWQGILDARAMLLRLQPKNLDHVVGYLQALVELEKFDVAEQTGAKLLAQRADLPRVRALVASAQRSAGKLAEAQATLDAAPEASANEPVLLAERAALLGATGALDAGIEKLRRAVELEPEAAKTHVALGQMLLRAGRNEEGLAALERALELDETAVEALLIRALYRSKSGDAQDAVSDLTRYLEARPEDGRAYLFLGMVQEGSGDEDAAVRAYRRAASLDADNFAARNNLAVLLERTGDIEGALESAQQAYALAGSNPNVLDTLGWLYLKKGLTERAIGLLERAHASDQKLATAQLHLGLAYRDAGRVDEARSLLAALEKRPDVDDATRGEATSALRTLTN